MRLPKTLTLLTLLALPWLGACLPATPGAFAPDGFHPAANPYVVHYTNPASHEILDANWRLDNYELAANGAPIEPKTGDRYVVSSPLDVRGDGDPLPYQHYIFDVKLDNRRTSGVIWLQTIPLTYDRMDRNLNALAEDYASALSGSGFYATVEDEGKVVRAKTYAAKILDGKATKVGDFDAYDARFELANVDQLKLDPNQRTAMIRIVFIRTSYMTTWGYAARDVTRALIRVGYYASPSDFDAGMPDFERFLKQIEFKHPTPQTQ